MVPSYEVIIVGGSYAGLSAAMALGRSLRTVLIIDSGLPCNRFTPHSHNVITHDGSKPGEIREKALEQVLKYPTVRIISDTALRAEATATGFTIATAGGAAFGAKKLLFATGVQDILPPVPGLAACWGISAIHCPYCHGYEFKAEPTAILANGDTAFHYALLLSQLTPSITVFTDGPQLFTEHQQEKLAQHSIPVIEAPLEEIVHENGYMSSIRVTGGMSYDVAAAYIRPASRQHCALPEDLGCSLTEFGTLTTDNMQKTTVEGIYAAGDCCNPMRSVSTAIAQGTMAGAAINATLCGEAF